MLIILTQNEDVGVEHATDRDLPLVRWSREQEMKNESNTKLKLRDDIKH